MVKREGRRGSRREKRKEMTRRKPRATARVENRRAPFSCQSRRLAGKCDSGKSSSWSCWAGPPALRAVEDDSQGKVRSIKKSNRRGASRSERSTVHVPMRQTMSFGGAWLHTGEDRGILLYMESESGDGWSGGSWTSP